MQGLAARVEINEGGFLLPPEAPASQEAYGEVKGHWQTVEHHKEQHIVSVKESETVKRMLLIEINNFIKLNFILV